MWRIISRGSVSAASTMKEDLPRFKVLVATFHNSPVKAYLHWLPF